MFAKYEHKAFKLVTLQGDIRITCGYQKYKF